MGNPQRLSEQLFFIKYQHNPEVLRMRHSKKAGPTQFSNRRSSPPGPIHLRLEVGPVLIRNETIKTLSEQLDSKHVPSFARSARSFKARAMLTNDASSFSRACRYPAPHQEKSVRCGIDVACKLLLNIFNDPNDLSSPPVLRVPSPQFFCSQPATPAIRGLCQSLSLNMLNRTPRPRKARVTQSLYTNQPSSIP